MSLRGRAKSPVLPRALRKREHVAESRGERHRLALAGCVARDVAVGDAQREVGIGIHRRALPRGEPARKARSGSAGFFRSGSASAAAGLSATEEDRARTRSPDRWRPRTPPALHRRAASATSSDADLRAARRRRAPSPAAFAPAPRRSASFWTAGDLLRRLERERLLETDREQSSSSAGMIGSSFSKPCLTSGQLRS